MEMSGEPGKFNETRFCGMDLVAGSMASCVQGPEAQLHAALGV